MGGATEYYDCRERVANADRENIVLTFNSGRIIEIDLERGKTIAYSGTGFDFREDEYPQLEIALQAICTTDELIAIKSFALCREYHEWSLCGVRVETSARLADEIEEKTAWRR